MRWVRRGVALALVVGVMIVGWRFAAENSTPVQVHLIARATPEIALWKALLAAFGCGAGLTGLGWLYGTLVNRLVARRYRKALGALESEIHQLRNLPLASEPPSFPPLAPDPPPAPADSGTASADAPVPPEALGRGA